MNRLLVRLFIIFLAVCGITSCAPPVGSISDGSGNGNGNGITAEFLLLRPNRILYEIDGGIDGSFDRSEDLRAFVTDNGEFKPIDPTDPLLMLELILNPGGFETIVEIITHYPFSEAGRHIIKGTYNGKTDQYSIEVRGSFVNPGEGSGSVEIEWINPN